MTLSARCRIEIKTARIRRGETIVALDVLRAASTIVTACSLGVETIIPVRDDAQAFTLRAQGVVIAGETECVKREGYDIGNSPVELIRRYHAAPFTRLALATTNLVPLLLSLPHAVICSSLNLASVAAFIKKKHLCIIAAGGTHGCIEDVGIGLSLACAVNGTSVPDAAITSCVTESAAARNLREKGLGEDVDFIARVNVFDVVPFYDGKAISKTR